MTNEHDTRWSDDVAVYALGALEGEEARALEAHMESCERCRSELHWLAPAVALLPEGAERVQPPRRLRDKVMAEVRADAKRERAGSRAPARSPGWSDRIRIGPLSWRPLAGLAVLALAVVAIGGYEIGSSDSGGGQAVTISAQQDSGVFAEVVRDGEGGTLQLANVERLPSDRVLEAWVEREGEIEAVPGLFSPDREGEASTRIADMGGVETVMVTREPEGGSEAPTSGPIVQLAIPG
jgi:anti-sigma-K factor RskA